jgi:hypothetical protein
MMNLIHLLRCLSLNFGYFDSKTMYSLFLLRNIENSFMHCVRCCRPYFSAMATQEILDEFRPCLCPFDTVCGDVMSYWDIFLPVHLPPELHHQGFKYDVILEDLL